mmetsp:Transcript_7679/g.14481  ORF Transcript_7679/g.14481 Transcript_7679/m.14481 type:complete len:319 (-) Transcript_7679:165-1121(-)
MADDGDGGVGGDGGGSIPAVRPRSRTPKASSRTAATVQTRAPTFEENSIVISIMADATAAEEQAAATWSEKEKLAFACHRWNMRFYDGFSSSQAVVPDAGPRKFPNAPTTVQLLQEYLLSQARRSLTHAAQAQPPRPPPTQPPTLPQPPPQPLQRRMLTRRRVMVTAEGGGGDEPPRVRQRAQHTAPVPPMAAETGADGGEAVEGREHTGEAAEKKEARLAARKAARVTAKEVATQNAQKFPLTVERLRENNLTQDDMRAYLVQMQLTDPSQVPSLGKNDKTERIQLLESWFANHPGEFVSPVPSGGGEGAVGQTASL